MHDLQDVGADLVRLSPERLARIEMPQSLREAVMAAQGITKHEARRRQLQYIGKLMRGIDVTSIAAQLAAFDAPSKQQTAVFHVAERWRLDLIDDPTGLERFFEEFPEADQKQVRELTEAARVNRGAGRGPRAFRELFHAVNTLIQDHARKNS